MIAPRLSILFYGTPTIAETCLEALISDPRYQVRAVVTQPDRPVGRKQILTPSPVKALALAHQIPVIQPENIRKESAAFQRDIMQFGPFDIAVVVAFGQILPSEVLELPKAGSLNLHASILPRWRGAAPIQRAIMAGDKETGVCLMRMEAGLDTGPVFASATTDITESDDASTVHDRLARDGAQLICQHLPNIVAGEIITIPQSETGVTYAKKITTSDCLIDWRESAESIAAHVRGLAPAPGAHTMLAGKRLKIFKTESIPETQTPAEPGSVLESEHKIRVACGKGEILITDMQLEGKKRCSSVEFLKGNDVPVGSVLGSSITAQEL